jgi:hypothetical protein
VGFRIVAGFVGGVRSGPYSIENCPENQGYEAFCKCCNKNVVFNTEQKIRRSMEAVLPVVLILTGFYVGWNIGANDAANCIGTMVGDQIISYRQAVLVVVFLSSVAALCRGTTVSLTWPRFFFEQAVQ